MAGLTHTGITPNVCLKKLSVSYLSLSLLSALPIFPFSIIQGHAAPRNRVPFTPDEHNTFFWAFA